MLVPLKIVEATDVTHVGIIKYSIFVIENALAPIVSTAGKVKEVNALQLAKAFCPIVLTLFGNLTSSSLEAEVNPFTAITVTSYSFPSISTFSGIIALVAVLSANLTSHSVSLIGVNVKTDAKSVCGLIDSLIISFWISY